MSAERVAALAEVLETHERFGFGCRCGWLSDDLTKTSREDHLTHAAKHLLAAVWDEGHLGLCRRHGVVPFAACRNPYREEQS